MEISDILPATEEDREWAAQLMARSEPWITLRRGLVSCRTTCSQPERQLFIAHAGSKPCGFILLQRRGVAGSPYIASIEVVPEFRGKGVGSRLLSFAEDLFRGEAKHIFLCVSSFNPRARALYERHGYSAVGELKDYIIDGASEILMHKRLGKS
ncbi:MAG TPA: N-acetyltransferase [Acidobacteriota bacterium]|nr:N-acetyltransferase [Acidobacteriota bacterium]